MLQSDKLISQLHEMDDQITIESVASLANGLNLLNMKHDAVKQAAVLIPLILEDQNISILLTERTKTLASHAGQISFPGGKMDQQDQSPEMTALRETKEETGLEDITLLSTLGTFNSYSGFEITTLVGLVNAPSQLNPNPAEVANIIEVPLPVVMDSSQFTLEHFERGTLKRSLFKLEYNQHNIWGFTGTILYLFGQYIAQMDL